VVRSLGHAGGIRAARTGLKCRQRLFDREEIAIATQYSRVELYTQSSELELVHTRSSYSE
jgi:hypothetical protein